MTDWGQSGDKLRTKWGHSYIVRFITHSLLLAFPLSLHLPHPTRYRYGRFSTVLELSAKGPSLGASTPKIALWITFLCQS